MLVSIIIPNYNRADLISETLDSILSQTYSSWETIIVDDGSSDESEKIILNYLQTDARFSYTKRNRLPKGAPTCRNLGIERAKGDYIIFLDSDDLLAPWCLRNRIDFAQSHDDASFFIFPMILFNEKPGDSTLLATSHHYNDISRFIIMDYPWTITSPIWKTDYLRDLNGFNEEYKLGQDWELHMRALINGSKYYWCDHHLPDCFYRKHTGVRVGKNISNETLYLRSLDLTLFFELTAEKEMKYSNDFLYSIYWNSILPLIRNKQFNLVEKIIKDSSFFKKFKKEANYITYQTRLYSLLKLSSNTVLEKAIRYFFIYIFIPSLKKRTNYFLNEHLNKQNMELLKKNLHMSKTKRFSL